MNMNHSDNPSEGMLCPKCKITKTIEHNDGQWCPRCGSFALPPDPRHTAHIQTNPPAHTRSFVNSRERAARSGGPICIRCGGPGDTGDGSYDDGEWICGGCIAGFA